QSSLQPASARQANRPSPIRDFLLILDSSRYQTQVQLLAQPVARQQHYLRTVLSALPVKPPAPDARPDTRVRLPARAAPANPKLATDYSSAADQSCNDANLET